MFRYSEPESIGQNGRIIYTPEDQSAHVPEQELRKALELGYSENERWHQRKDGSLLYGSGIVRPLQGKNGDVIGFTKVMRDQTTQKLTEQALQASEERFRTLVQNIHDYAIFLLDANGYVTEWPEGAQRVKGYTPEEAVGQHLSIFFTPEDRAAGEVEKELDQAAREGRAEREAWRVRKNGERFWVNEIATAIYDEAGKVIGFTKISRDLTARRQMDTRIGPQD